MRHRRFVSAMLTGLIFLSTAVRADEPPMEPLTEPEMDAGSLMHEFHQDHDGALRRYTGTTFLLQGRVIESAVIKGPDGHVHVHLKLGGQTSGGEELLPLWIDFDSKMADQVTPLSAGDPVKVEVTYRPAKTTKDDHGKDDHGKDDKELHGFLGLKFVGFNASPGNRFVPGPSVASNSPPTSSAPNAAKRAPAVPDPDASTPKPRATLDPPATVNPRTPVAPPATPPANDNPAAESVRDKAVNWVRSHSAFPPIADGSDARMVVNMITHIDESLDAGKDLQMYFSPQTMKSGQAEALCIHNGCMVIVDFTPEQFAATGDKPGTVVVRLAHVNGSCGDMNAAISQIQLDGNGSWDVTQSTKGSLHLKTPADFDTENLWVRAVFVLPKGATSTAHRIKPDADGNCSFELQSSQDFMQAVVQTKSSGPQVVLFEVVRIHTGDDGKPAVEIISKPNGLVMQLSVAGSGG
jgi:hypothetical protein